MSGHRVIDPTKFRADLLLSALLQHHHGDPDADPGPAGQVGGRMKSAPLLYAGLFALVVAVVFVGFGLVAGSGR